MIRSNRLDFFVLHKWKENTFSKFIKETDFSVAQVSKISGLLSSVDVNYWLHIEDDEIPKHYKRLFEFFNYMCLFCGSDKVVEMVKSFIQYEESLKNPPF